MDIQTLVLAITVVILYAFTILYLRFGGKAAELKIILASIGDILVDLKNLVSVLKPTIVENADEPEEVKMLKVNNLSQSDFIKLILPAAIANYKKGILTSLTLAQAILESDWGNSAPGNNLFGIKWTENCGFDKQLLWTYEFIDGVETKVQDYFRKYDSLQDAIDDHGVFLRTNSRYSNILFDNNFVSVCNNIQADGYASDPNYASSLINLISVNGLNKWDDPKYAKVFTSVADATLFIASENVSNSPDYWLKATGIINNLNFLLLAIANTLANVVVVRSNKVVVNSSDAIVYLASLGMLNDADYWIIAVKTTRNLDILLINTANTLSGRCI
jgi:hypothetical protein